MDCRSFVNSFIPASPTLWPDCWIFIVSKPVTEANFWICRSNNLSCLHELSLQSIGLQAISRCFPIVDIPIFGCWAN